MVVSCCESGYAGVHFTPEYKQTDNVPQTQNMFVKGHTLKILDKKHANHLHTLKWETCQTTW